MLSVSLLTEGDLVELQKSNDLITEKGRGCLPSLPKRPFYYLNKPLE